ncbi:MAG TPA: diguanylate cyclase [Myxococcales bacterium]|nr:diguanylate cyclase [Myxococcales bacterium]
MAVQLQENERPWLLVVDDENEILNLLVRSLRDDYHVLTAQNGREALTILEEHDVAVVITDQRMPLMSGLELLKETMRKRPDARRILMTGYADMQLLVNAVNDGQVDRLIPKPFAGNSLKRSVGDILELRRLQMENRRLLTELADANESLRKREELLERDLDERGKSLLSTNRELERLNAHLASLARRDGLTNLYNHRTLMERLAEEIARAKRCGTPLSLVFGDLDHFKIYNDRFGHPKGDEALVAVSRILAGEAGEAGVHGRASDIVARYGGEEFVLLLPETDRSGARIKAERLRSAIEKHAFHGGETQPAGRLTISFGVSSFPTDAATADELVSRADEALYAAKHSGRNQVAVAGSLATAGGGAAREVGSYRRLLPVLGGRLCNDGALAALSITLTQLTKVEAEYGAHMCRTLLSQLEESVLQAVGVFGETPIVGTCEDESKLSLLVFLPGRRAARSTAGADIEALADRLEAALHHHLLKLQRLIPGPGRVVVGWGEGVYTSRMPVERIVADITAEAAESSARRLAMQQSRDRTLLRQLLVEEQLVFHYQPIVTKTGERYGVEALVRGPADFPWPRPDQLFGRASEVGLLDELDRSCCLAAIRGASGKLSPTERLFINVLPSTLYDQAFVGSELPAALSTAGIPPGRVVLEVTEQHAIESLAVFQESLSRVVEQGMAIALDDVGTGNSNLHALLEIRPAFVKLDRQLIDGVSTHGVKRQLVAALVAAASAMPAQLIAEGVEQPEDAQELDRLGIGLLQGFLFGRPAPF